MGTTAGKQRADELYHVWIKGTPVKKLTKDFGVSRQRIYQILNSYKHITEKDKLLRAVNKFSEAASSETGRRLRARTNQELARRKAQEGSAPVAFLRGLMSKFIKI